MNPPTPAAAPIRLPLLLTLGLTAGLTPLAIDLYLPSIPAIAADLGSSVELVQLSVTIYLAVFALAQIVLGPLSDVLGRRATVLGGAGIFLAANLGCILAPDLAWLLGARAEQALGGAAVAVTIPALVRDLFGKEDYARVRGMVMMVMAAAPLLAPTLGSAI
ncbi:MAG TPA: MFS transporter, partial [Chromatiaceae bacterium]|nr:MFS transporter [Chromatiaceae bacterium]